MNARIVTTPIGPPPGDIAPRTGGIDPALRPAFHGVGRSVDAIERLFQPGTLAVTTGQQPGLLGGPLYTLYKALSAAALARRLEDAWSRPVVPVFWSAGDDHDFIEASHAAWLGRDGELQRAVLRTRPADAPLTPMYREPLGAEIDAVLATFAATLPASPFNDEALAWVREAYRSGTTVAGAYRHALVPLLAQAGIPVFESTHPAVKRAAAPLLLSALDAAAPLDRDLAARAAELAAAGADPGVATGDGATLVMLEAAAGRDRLVTDGTGFATRRSGERFSAAELRQVADSAPERLSPNVLLRPVVESALLPTVAYAGGPGELRYLALTAPVYARLGIPRQQPVARWSGVIVEPRVDRVLEKFGLQLDDLREPAADVERRVIRARLPGAALTGLADVRRAIADAYDRIAAAAPDVDPTLEAWVAGVRNRSLAAADDVEQKLLRHLKRREATELRQLEHARAAVQPDGQPQERVLATAAVVARYGDALVPALLEAIGSWQGSALVGAEAAE